MTPFEVKAAVRTDSGFFYGERKKGKKVSVTVLGEGSGKKAKKVSVTDLGEVSGKRCQSPIWKKGD